MRPGSESSPVVTAATTVADIAAAAGVHVRPSYELVGRKPVILRELLERAISGTDRAVPPRSAST